MGIFSEALAVVGVVGVRTHGWGQQHGWGQCPITTQTRQLAWQQRLVLRSGVVAGVADLSLTMSLCRNR